MSLDFIKNVPWYTLADLSTSRPIVFSRERDCNGTCCKDQGSTLGERMHAAIEKESMDRNDRCDY
jgi:hypothetical protein